MPAESHRRRSELKGEKEEGMFISAELASLNSYLSFVSRSPAAAA